jgi:hypothetical protein
MAAWSMTRTVIFRSNIWTWVRIPLKEFMSWVFILCVCVCAEALWRADPPSKEKAAKARQTAIEP